MPALAIGRAIVDAGHPAPTIRFVGSSRGLERTLVPAAGFSVTLLPGRGIARRFTLDNIGAAAGLVVAALRAVWLVGGWRPRVVVSVGGYASVPCALAAVVWRIPLVVQEQNAVPGLANRLFGRFAAAAAVAFPGTPLPNAVVTGNPVRPELTNVDRRPAGRRASREALGIPIDRRMVAISGGSLGAKRINDAAIELARHWADRPNVAIRHVVGARDWDAVRAAAPAPTPGGLMYQQIRYEDRMDLLYSAADVAVQRSGASIFELAVAGVPAVLVPLPGAPGDHQAVNAQRLAAAGAAVVVPDHELSADRLGAELERLLGDQARLDSMAAAAAAAARPDAAACVARLVEAHARE